MATRRFWGSFNCRRLFASLSPPWQKYLSPAAFETGVVRKLRCPTSPTYTEYTEYILCPTSPTYKSRHILLTSTSRTEYLQEYGSFAAQKNKLLFFVRASSRRKIKVTSWPCAFCFLWTIHGVRILSGKKNNAGIGLLLGEGEERKRFCWGGNRPRGALSFTANWHAVAIFPCSTNREGWKTEKLDFTGPEVKRRGEELRWWGEVEEIRGKWGGGGASSVDTPGEDERPPLFKTSWSRSPDTALH